jgi:O-antigen ligase
MSRAPRPLTADELREVRDASRRQARELSGIGVALIGVASIAFLMLAIIVLDYKFHQPFHRVAKLLGAGALGLGVVLKPWLGLLVFPVILPFLSWIPPVPIPGMNTLNLLLGTVFTVWAINRVMRSEPILRSSTLGGVIAAMIFVLALGVVRGAVFPAGFQYNPYMAVLSAFRSSLSMVVFYIALLMVRGEKARRSLIWAVVIGVAAEAVTTLALGRNGRGARAIGSIGQANELGTFLALGAVMAMALVSAVKNWMGKAFLLGVTALATVGVVLSLSRTALIAVAVGLLYVTLRSSRGLALVLIAVALTGPIWAPDYLKDRIMETSASAPESEAVEGVDEVQLDNAAQVRVDTWKMVLKIVEEHPLDGVGYDGLHQALPQSAEMMGVDAADSSHNTFLRMLGEEGIVGIALFVWLLWKCWALSAAALRAARTRFDRQLGIGLGAATLGLAISCAFGDRFFNIMITGGFWILCALAEDILHEAKAAAPAAGPRS